MDDNRVGAGAEPAERAGTTRRNMLFGATTIAAATAVTSAIGAPPAGAAPVAGQITCTVPTIGTFAVGSFQWGAGAGVTSPSAGGTRTASTPSVSEVVITKVTDGSSTGLFRALLSGTVLKTVTITFTFATGTPSISLVLHDVILSGFSTSSGGEVPSESVSLNLASFTQTINGDAVTYDLATSKVS